MLHPLKVMKGVVAGVRDYGNRMGIPTVNGAVCFDPALPGQPAGLLRHRRPDPGGRCVQEGRAGDLIVAVGGRTGRDGIHGATFSSIELTRESEKVSGGAVQIGNAITEKKAAGRAAAGARPGLYNAITDCGAGGFSSAVGEMGENIGADVDLEKAPLKYAGLSYTEIWISESQERMVLAVRRRTGTGLQPAVRSRGRGGDRPGHVRGDRPAAAVLPGRAGRRTWRWTSCTTAGRRWSARRRGVGNLAAAGRRSQRRPNESCRFAGICSRQLKLPAGDPGFAQRLQQGMDHPPVRP